jgi:hypothetical protein
MTLGARGSEPSMIAGGFGGRRIPQVLRGGVHEVGGARGGKQTGDLTHCQRFITQPPEGVLRGLKGCLASSPGSFVAGNG